MKRLAGPEVTEEMLEELAKLKWQKEGHNLDKILPTEEEYKEIDKMNTALSDKAAEIEDALEEMYNIINKNRQLLDKITEIDLVYGLATDNGLRGIFVEDNANTVKKMIADYYVKNGTFDFSDLFTSKDIKQVIRSRTEESEVMDNYVFSYQFYIKTIDDYNKEKERLNSK